jgi:hypothetical protein
MRDNLMIANRLQIQGGHCGFARQFSFSLPSSGADPVPFVLLGPWRPSKSRPRNDVISWSFVRGHSSFLTPLCQTQSK